MPRLDQYGNSVSESRNLVFVDGRMTTEIARQVITRNRYGEVVDVVEYGKLTYPTNNPPPESFCYGTHFASPSSSSSHPNGRVIVEEDDDGGITYNISNTRSNRTSGPRPDEYDDDDLDDDDEAEYEARMRTKWVQKRADREARRKQKDILRETKRADREAAEARRYREMEDDDFDDDSYTSKEKEREFLNDMDRYFRSRQPRDPMKMRPTYIPSSPRQPPSSSYNDYSPPGRASVNIGAGGVSVHSNDGTAWQVNGHGVRPMNRQNYTSGSHTTTNVFRDGELVSSTVSSGPGIDLDDLLADIDRFL